MPWVQRDISSTIIGCFANRQPGFADEFLANTDPAVIAFLTPIVLDAVDRLDLVALKVAFNHENRIRALEAKAPITLAQFKTALRAL